MSSAMTRSLRQDIFVGEMVSYANEFLIVANDRYLLEHRSDLFAHADRFNRLVCPSARIESRR